MPYPPNSKMSFLRMACPLCDRAKSACWLCDSNGLFEFWLPDEQVSTFQHDPCIVLRTVPTEDFIGYGKKAA